MVVRRSQQRGLAFVDPSFRSGVPFYLCPARTDLLCTSVCLCCFCTFYSGHDLYLILSLFLILAWLLLPAWTVDPMLGVSESVWEKWHGLGPAARLWCLGTHTLGHCFHLCLCLLLIKSSWVCGVDYQLVPDLVTESHYVTSRSS